MQVSSTYCDWLYLILARPCWSFILIFYLWLVFFRCSTLPCSVISSDSPLEKVLCLLRYILSLKYDSSASSHRPGNIGASRELIYISKAWLTYSIHCNNFQVSCLIPRPNLELPVITLSLHESSRTTKLSIFATIVSFFHPPLMIQIHHVFFSSFWFLPSSIAPVKKLRGQFWRSRWASQKYSHASLWSCV